MISREHNITDPSKWLRDFFSANKVGYKGFRRRAVLSHSNDKWNLVACAIEAITAETAPIEPVSSRYYPQAVLLEDWPSIEDMLTTVNEVSAGRLRLGELIIDTTDTHRNWNREQVPLSNIHMPRAGYVLSARFDARNLNMYETLYSVDEPYYPDLTEAVRHWLPFHIYHGNSDSRNGEIVFLLPETRAYLIDAIPNEGTLNVQVAGSQVGSVPLLINGAWWDETGIHHFKEKVSGNVAQLRVSEKASRLDYMLTDLSGTIYDYQHEDEYRHAGLGRKRLTNAEESLVALVREACRNGEGLKVEFKPFIEPDPKNNKFAEIVKTVVAFSNTQGGRIYFGINDDCGLQGIDEQLSRWAKGKADEAACGKYLGALRGRIRDVVAGEPVMQFKHTTVDGRLIAIIEVSEAQERPISIRQDQYLYIRRGSSNAKASPEEWKMILTNQREKFSN